VKSSGSQQPIDGKIKEPAKVQQAAKLIGKKFAGRKIGIGVRLFGAFGAVAFLTLAASGVAWFSFSNVGQVLSEVTGRSVPAMNEALRLATVSASLSAEAPALVAARDDAERSKQNAVLQKKIADMAATLNNLSKRIGQSEQFKTVAGLTQQTTENLLALDSAVAEMLRLRAARHAKVGEITRVHSEILAVTVPMVDDVYFELVIEAEAATELGGTAVSELFDTGVSGVMAVLRTDRQLLVPIAKILGRSAAGHLQSFDACERRADRFGDAVRQVCAVSPRAQVGER
jgi:phosphoglycerate-specific signal transduction histidine kinase